MASPTRARLLRAAEELFYGDGIATTGVDAVVTRAGVALGSLYNNFGGKEGLVAAYLEARDRRWQDHWEAAVAARSDPVERVLALFTALEDWDFGGVPSRGCAHLAALAQLPGDDPARDVARVHKRAVFARLRELVVATGVADPDETARDVVLLYEGALASTATDVDPVPVARARRLAAARLAAG